MRRSRDPLRPPSLPQKGLADLRRSALLSRYRPNHRRTLAIPEANSGAGPTANAHAVSVDEFARLYPLLGMGTPRCRYALWVAILPRGVRWMRPLCSRYGSYTSSTVSRASPRATEMVPMPTGPPSNLS